MNKVNVKSIWSETFELGNIRLSAESDNDTVVVVVGENRDRTVVKLSREQVYELRSLLNQAVYSLEEKKHWPKKPVLR